MEGSDYQRFGFNKDLGYFKAPCKCIGIGIIEE